MVDEVQLKEKLKQVFGYNSFRGRQESIINNILSGNNTFVIMPTGAGKSMCYQLPAICQDGMALVVSPLIALMKNQVDQLRAFGVKAYFLNSTLNKSESTKVKKEAIEGKVKLLYVAPESLTKEENIDFLKQVNLSFAAIDEAHCISEWGHDFRPEYRKIKSIIEHLGKMPIIALTATATPKVQLDIQRNLQMEAADVFKSSFNRTNLFYEVRPKQQAKKQLVRIIREHKGQSGIVYCLSRKKVEELAAFLRLNDINAAPYHAGIDSNMRMKNQDDFLNEEVDVIVATIAFGMGIDKPDVRFVIHYDVPKSIEGYYQETGRAGRDGLEGRCVMFYSYNDIIKLEKFNKDKPVTERENAKILLEEMASYAESSVCRRKQLLHYFGEEFDAEGCDNGCDNCKHPKEKFEGKDFVMTVLKAVKDTGERFTLPHIASVILGLENQYTKSYSQHDLDVFGSGSSETEFFWRSVIRQTLLFQYLLKDIDNVGVLKLSSKGHEFINKQHSVELSKDQEIIIEGHEEEDGEKEAVNTKSYDAVLYDLLKGLRKKIAKEKGVPPYVVFQDPSLEEIATVYPTNRDELAQVNGVGMGKVSKFGKPFLELINKYVTDNDIITAGDVTVKSAGARSKNKIFIIQQVDMKIDVDEIAESLGIKYEDVISEMENICYSGTKLNLDYYINQLMDKDRQADVYDYFLNAESDSMNEALEEIDEDVSEDEIRLMRIKFLSEFAN